jgi:K+-sensing histidine kinase KdpD
LSQAIYNLLDNAIKFTKEEGTISIKVEKKRDSNNNNKEVVIVSINDTGSRIDSNILPRLFERFVLKSHKSIGIRFVISKSIKAHVGKYELKITQMEKMQPLYLAYLSINYPITRILTGINNNNYKTRHLF